MNSKYLGDAFDHWKGSIIQRLETAKPRKLLEDITVVPMITDPKCWNRQKRLVYSRLLNVKPESILGWEKEPPSSGDLFLDPDTGVYTRKSKEHITPKEIRELLDGDPTHERVILIYQHGARGQSSEKRQCQLETKVSQVFDEKIDGGKPNLHAAIFNCNHAAMLFFSYSKGRIKKIETYLKKILPNDPMSKSRILILSK